MKIFSEGYLILAVNIVLVWSFETAIASEGSVLKCSEVLSDSAHQDHSDEKKSSVTVNVTSEERLKLQSILNSNLNSKAEKAEQIRQLDYSKDSEMVNDLISYVSQSYIKNSTETTTDTLVLASLEILAKLNVDAANEFLFKKIIEFRIASNQLKQVLPVLGKTVPEKVDQLLRESTKKMLESSRSDNKPTYKESHENSLRSEIIISILKNTEIPSKDLLPQFIEILKNDSFSYSHAVKMMEALNTPEADSAILEYGVNHSYWLTRSEALDILSSKKEKLTSDSAKWVVYRLNQLSMEITQKRGKKEYYELDQIEENESKKLIDLLAGNSLPAAIKALQKFGSSRALYAIAKNRFTPEIAKIIIESDPSKAPINFLKAQFNTTHYGPPSTYYANPEQVSQEIKTRVFGIQLILEYVRLNSKTMEWKDKISLVELLIKNGIEHGTLGVNHSETQFYSSEAPCFRKDVG